MLNSPVIDIRKYRYDLPEEKIAKYPLPKRDDSKLLIYSKNCITQDKFRNLSSYLDNSVNLYYNNTRVIHARLKFRKQTGAAIEIFCLSPVEPVDYQMAFSTEKCCTWDCLVGNLGKWKDEILTQKFLIQQDQVILNAEKIEVESSGVRIRFSWKGNYSFGQIIEHLGVIPIPPYLNRDTEDIDNDRYQTVYSKPAGSVAAPTAGLHFTPEVLDSLTKRLISLNEITLHVGAGTFQPVKADNALNHIMHSEFFSVDISVIEKLSIAENSIISTGTTTMRALESLFWLAVKSLQSNSVQNFVQQWEYRELATELNRREVFSKFLVLMQKEKRKLVTAHTSIMIVPGYKFRMTDGLITNFHQPGSTLLLLIAAFVGDDWLEIYEYALKNDFRFLSYGDSSLLLPFA